jgi:predicted transcriptional regulator
MKVSECMSKNVRIANPDETVQQAAQMMAELDSGVLPVGDADHLVGILSLGDLTWSVDESVAARAMNDISKPGGRHNQAR